MNEQTASIARNTKIMMTAQLITWASSFVLMSYLPRYLGAEEYGKLYFGMSISALAALLMDLGLTMLIVREVARDHGKISSFFFNGGALRIFAWAVSLVITLGFVVLSGYPTTTIEIVLILGIGNLFLGGYEIIHRIFVGLERLEFRSIGMVSEKVFLAIVGVTMLKMGHGPIAIAFVILLSLLLNFLVSYYFLRRITPLNPQEFRPSTWPSLLREGFPFMISMVFGFIFYRVDVMMLSRMTNDAVVGWYGAPYRLFDTLMFFPVILNTAVYPVLSRLFQTSKENVNATARRLLHLTLVAAVPVAVGMLVLAEPIISLLFGLPEYANSIVLLQLLSVSLILVYADFVFSTVLLSYNKQKEVSWIAVIATFVSITLNYFAITYFQEHYGNGAIGSAIATAITEAFVLVSNLYFIPRGCFRLQDITVGFKTLAVGALMAVCIYGMEMLSLPWPVAGIAGLAAYGVLLYALRIVSSDDLDLLAGMVPFRGVSSVLRRRIQPDDLQRQERTAPKVLALFLDLNAADDAELERLEAADQIPRATLFRKLVHCEILDKRMLGRAPVVRRFFYRFLPFDAAQTIEAFIIQHRYDAVLSWNERSAYLFALLCKLTRRKHVPHISMSSWPARGYKAFLIRLVKTHIDRFILWSSVQRKIVTEKLGVPPEKIAFTHYFVDQKFFRPCDRPTDILCSVGSEMRDYRTLLDAMNGLDIRCHIAAGTLRGENTRWVRAVKAYGSVPPNVTIGKKTPVELRELYARSRFVVIPLLQSNTDNGITCILEAFAMGKPVICSRIEGQVDVIRDGETGIYVPVGDSKALREAILRLWNDPERAARMGRAARKYVEEQQTLDGFVDVVRKVVMETIEQSRLQM